MASIKLYDVEFNSDLPYSKSHSFQEINFQWEKSSNYPNYKYNPSTDAEREEQTELKAQWDTFSLEDVIKNHPDRVDLKWDCRRQILTEEQFEQLYKYCNLTNILYPAVPSKIELNLEDLANRIVNKLATSLLKETT
jgi:hypothetical protein